MAVQSIGKQFSRAMNDKAGELLRLGAAGIFILLIIAFMGEIETASGSNVLLLVAAVVGGYMAMNIGANDVANNVGPSVGSGALTLGAAVALAALFEASGALIAGGDVVGTVKKGIIDPALIRDVDTFVWLMLAALLAAALWLNLATAMGAPVSTTHSIVGGVLGAGIAAGGLSVANWVTMGKIAASWVISPLMGGLIAAGFLYFIKRTVIYQKDMIAAGRRMVPVLIAVLAWALTTYLLIKGVKKIWKVELALALAMGLGAAIAVYLIVKPIIARAARHLANERQSIDSLFTFPLIVAAAMLSFAHGANDVANAVGPLAAINDALTSGHIAKKAAIPLWVMMVGALGIAVGLMLYGPKLIRAVGSEITELDKIRAFCIALAAAITVIIATHLGLPVSSTHIAVGGVFGVGFLREYLAVNYGQMIEEIKHHHEGKDPEIVAAFLAEFEAATLAEKGKMLKALKKKSKRRGLKKKERKSLRKAYKEELVRRSLVYRIAAAWVITVPATGFMAAFFYFTIRGIMLP